MLSKTILTFTIDSFLGSNSSVLPNFLLDSCAKQKLLATLLSPCHCDSLSLSLTVMAFASVIAFLLLQTLSATSDFLSPLYDDVCKEAECGKGTCKPSKNGTLLFECDCDPGWKKSLSARDDGFDFLPCIVPNCTLNYSCSKAPAPVQQKERKANESVFDACHWIDCGGGSCNKTSFFSYSCNCDAGYYNLLNATALPCYRECALGLGCSDLGISMTNSSTPAPPPTMDENDSLILRGSSSWLLMLSIFIANTQLQ